MNQAIANGNVLAIGNELMLLIARPESEDVTVERGFGGTTITTHDSGDKVYQSGKFALRNLLVYTHQFYPEMIVNHNFTKWNDSAEILYSNWNDDPLNVIQDAVDINTSTGQGRFQNMVDPSLSTYMRTVAKMDVGDIDTGGNKGGTYFSFDLRFKQIEREYAVIGWYPSMAWDMRVALNKAPVDSTSGGVQSVRVYSPSSNVYPDLSNDTSIRTDSSTHLFVWFASVLIGDGSLDISQSGDNTAAPDRLYRMYMQNPNMSIDSLSLLNNKWKVVIYSEINAESDNDENLKLTSEFNMKRIGFWVDFASDYTKEKIVGELEGRAQTALVVNICGGGTNGNLAINIIHCLTLLLTEEMNYTASDFESSFSAAYTYSNSASNYDAEFTPEVVMSYGVDDKQIEGWSLVSKIANDFNFQLHKSSTGELDIVNMHEIFMNTPATSHAINIEDINFVNGEQLINIKQTGTDLIYNDVIVKYARNNALDTYSKVYEIPEDYDLLNAGHTLATARTNYYNGEKRTKVIESYSIWSARDAAWLAKTIIEEFAEVHFYVSFTINFDHYSDVNDLEVQYKQGDLIHLNGIKGGIEFTETEKLYVHRIEYVNNGQDILLKVKSIKPISEFTKA
jgi:hypothetical protein